MGYKIDEVEGIGPAYREKLGAAGIKSTDDFLKLCCDKKGRKAVAESTGISEKLILNWANKSDLMRISGVGPQFSELLEAAGVDTVKELKMRRADNLAKKMAEVNAEKKLAKTSPVEKVVAGWVEQAKTLPPTMTY